jgi:hypothetical protein
MRVPRSDAKCKKCGLSFRVPVLSDFVYGEFICFGQNGKSFVYLNSFAEKAWNEIELDLKEFMSDDKNNGYTEETECFQNVIGKCIDKIDGEEFSITKGPVCPKCLSHSIERENVLVDFIEIPNATFDYYFSLDDQARKDYIRKLWYICKK